MSKAWADRQRRTNRLVRACAAFLFARNEVTADQLLGLCKLTWITRSFDGADAGYIASTKIPALGQIFLREYSSDNMKEMLSEITRFVGKSAAQLTVQDTGFTNFYNAYRNSVGAWISANQHSVFSLLKRAYSLNTDLDGLGIVRDLSTLPKIPRANSNVPNLAAENLLSPVLFALDQRIRFPVINGQPDVRRVLKKLNVSNASLEQQFTAMVGLYGQAGIKDAADLDQFGQYLDDVVPGGPSKPKRSLLEEKPIGEDQKLPLKDEADLLSLQQAMTVVKRRIHNTLTNTLRKTLCQFTLFEGSDPTTLYDVLVKNFDDADNDLLLEAKSSSERSHIRMAIGQLYDYWFRLYGVAKPNLAVLLPDPPEVPEDKLMNWLNIGVLWFDGEQLMTRTDWLAHLAKLAPVD